VGPALAQLHALYAHLDFIFIKAPVCQLAQLVSMSTLLVVAQHAHRIVVPALAQLHALHAHLDFTFIKAPVCQLA